MGTITILQILPNNQNNPYLNQATPKKFLPNFTTQKDLGIENFKPPKILWSSLSLEIRSTPPPPMGFVGAFWSENGYRLCLSGMVFEGTTVEYERICYFSSKWLIKKDIYANLKWILTKLFCCCPNLSNDDIFSQRPGLKTAVENNIFWSEIGSEFGEQGGTPPSIISRSTPQRFFFVGFHMTSLKFKL